MKPPIPEPWGIPESQTQPEKKDVQPVYGPHLYELTHEVRKEIEDSVYGKEEGWVVEYRNHPVALLTDCSHCDPDMFWDNYKVTWLTEDEALISRSDQWDFWYDDETVIRNRKYPNIGPLPDPMISTRLEIGRVGARRLFLDIFPPEEEEQITEPTTLWGRFLKWLVT
ncbi:hypothetical protein EON80_15030 [bacterium]|nr:MAG: hypothetical protein EON80_15030 [bacterium]